MYTFTVGKTDYHFDITPEDFIVMDYFDIPDQIAKAKEMKNDRMVAIIFYNLILLSYCKVDKKGKPKKKTVKDMMEFMKSRAFNYIWNALAYDSDLATTFVNNIVPSAEDVKKFLDQYKNINKKIIF